MFNTRSLLIVAFSISVVWLLVKPTLDAWISLLGTLAMLIGISIEKKRESKDPEPQLNVANDGPGVRAASGGAMRAIEQPSTERSE